MDLIIQPEEVGILARPISQHIDREQLVAYITEVEQLQIRSALGGVLFSEIKQSPSTFDIILNGGSDEVGEVSGGIRKAMAYYVYARVIREGGTIPTRWGAVEKTDEYATRLAQEQKNTIYRECNNIADAYMAEVVNYAKAQGWMDAQGANPTRMMAYVVGSEEADADKMPCKSRQSVNANLVAGDGINIVDGEISVNMGEVQRGTGMTALAQRVTNAETNIEEVRRLATQREEVTVGNGLIKDDKGSISVDFEVVASNAEITNIRTTANEAKTEARQAKKLAEDAISTLEAINQIASDAKTTAQSAKTEANSAVTTAVDAVGVAINSLETAGQATEMANDALVKANSAQTSATNAENSAKASAQSASSAKSSAENAKKSAEEVAKGIASIDGKVSESVSKAVDGAFNDVNQALETKAPKVGYAPDLKVNFAKELVGRGVAEPQEIGVIRPTGEISIGDGNATIEKVKGNSVVWNQYAPTDLSSYTALRATYKSYEGGILTATSTNANKTSYIYKNASEVITSKLHRIVYCFAEIKVESTDAEVFMVGLGEKYFPATGDWQKIQRLEKVSVWSGAVIGAGVKVKDGMVSYSIRKLKYYDLTQMFGAGNEPTTIEEFEARKPLNVTNEYNEGTIVSYDGDALKSVGFNAYNGTYAKVIGGEEYHATGTTSISFAKELDGDATPITLDDKGKFKPEEDGYVFAEGKDIVIHLTHSYTPEHVDEYEEDVHPLPDVESILDANGNQLFPYGLLSAGSVYDEITATKAIKRVEVIPLSDIEFYFAPADRYYYTEGFFYSNYQKGGMNISLCSHYVTKSWTGSNSFVTEYWGNRNSCLSIWRTIADMDRINILDDSVANANELMAKLKEKNVLLYYELAEPIEVDLPEPLNLTYDAWDFGTEELIAEGATTPLNADIVYQFNAVDRIRENTAKNQALEKELAELKAQLTQLTQLSNEDSNT